jgi:hypothetical protein
MSSCVGLQTDVCFVFPFLSPAELEWIKSELSVATTCSLLLVHHYVSQEFFFLVWSCVSLLDVNMEAILLSGVCRVWMSCFSLV